ncbi:Possible membrane transport protein [Klebsiella pneumoniae IS22]|nr:Possible membrane transport protein [Klebsiella pneumoniae IS22]
MTYRHRVATVFLFGFFLDLINMFIASIAFPAISRALAVSVSQLAWVSNAYILGLTVVVPFSAWLSERWGAKRLFLLSLGLFSLGALAAGLANSLSEMILWRTLQGMGGGLLIPLGQALTWPLFQPHERAKLSRR